MAKLAEAHILSAPLVLSLAGTPDASGQAPVSYQVMAFISVRDFLRGLVERAQEVVLPTLPLLRRMSGLSALGHSFAAEPVMALHVSDDGGMLFRGAAQTTTLLELVRAGFLHGPAQRPALAPRHRVGVFDAHGHITDIISQADVVAWLRARPAALGALATHTLRELSLVSDTSARHLVTVHSTLPADLALAIIAVQNISAVGVVDVVSGALVASFSESDFRGVKPDDFGSFALPVAQYLVYSKGLPAFDTAEAAMGVPERPGVRIHDAWAAALHEAGAAITLPPDATLADAMDTLALRRIHRVFVVDPTTLAPLAVVTHTDVLGVIIRGQKL